MFADLPLQMPYWFQEITGATPSKSGVMILPLLVGVILAVVISGALVSVVGYYTPFMIGGSICMSIGAGLMTILTPHTSGVVRSVNLAIFGVGVGIGFQQPMIAAQTVLKGRDIPLGTSVVVFSQTFGGAVILSVAQSVFNNRLVANEKAEGMSDADIHALLESGAKALRDKFSSDVFTKVLNGYNNAITQTFYVALTAATVSIVGALAMEWKSVKAAKKPVRKADV